MVCRHVLALACVGQLALGAVLNEVSAAPRGHSAPARVRGGAAASHAASSSSASSAKGGVSAEDDAFRAITAQIGALEHRLREKDHRVVDVLNHDHTYGDEVRARLRLEESNAQALSTGELLGRTSSILPVEAVGQAEAESSQPPVTDSLQATEDDVFQAITAQIGSLESRLQEVHSAKVENMRDRKHEQRQQLLKQIQDSKVVASSNLELLSEIQSLRRGNAFLRSRAQSLAKGNEEQKDSLKAIGKNLTLASGYVNTTIAVSTGSDSEAYDLKVLEEFNAHDLEQEAAHEREDRIREITKFYDGDMDSLSSTAEPVGEPIMDETFPGLSASLLEVGASVWGPEPVLEAEEEASSSETQSAAGVTSEQASRMSAGVDVALQNVESKLEDLSQQHAENAFKLELAFQKAYKSGERRMGELLKEQDHLKKRCTELRQTRSQLNDAIGRLRKTRVFLLDQKKAIGGYMMRLAQRQKHA